MNTPEATKTFKVHAPKLVGPAFQLITGLVAKNPDLPVRDIADALGAAFDLPGVLEQFDDDFIMAAISVVHQLTLGKPGDPTAFSADIPGLIAAVASFAQVVATKFENADLPAIADSIDTALVLPWPFEAIDGIVILSVLRGAFVIHQIRQAA